MSKKDYYSVLGVSKNASDEEIRKSYRKMAIKHHPDTNKDDPSATDRFKEISEAYEVLRDKEKRRVYDQFGHAGLNGQPQGPGFGGFDFNFNFNPTDMFRSFFHQHTRAPADLRIKVDITLEESATGVDKPIQYNRNVECHKCHGEGGDTSQCDVCKGYGRTERQQGFARIVFECQSCGGTGQKVVKQCTECHGKGQISHQETVSVKIPPGIRSGESMRLRGYGEQGPYPNMYGDLICTISIISHNIFERKDEDILFTKDITFKDACLGVILTVPTIYNENMQIKIPSGTTHGQAFRIKEKGIKRQSQGGTKIGDQYVVIRIVVPMNLSPEAVVLLEQFDTMVARPAL